MDPKRIDKNKLIMVRDAVPTDENLIYTTWLKGLRHSNAHFSAMHGDSYFKAYHNIIDTIIHTPGVSVKVACLIEDPDVILSYAVYQWDTLHWVFTKKAWRGIGLAKSLIPGGIKAVTHITKIGQSVLKSHPEVRFDPFLI